MWSRIDLIRGRSLLRARGWIFLLFLTVCSSRALAAKSSYFRYENVQAYLLRQGTGWRVRDFASIAFNPNADRQIKVVFKITANDPNFLFCASGPASCQPGPVYSHVILDKFGETARAVASGINTPGLLFPPANLVMPYDFHGTVEVYSCNDLDPNADCEAPRTEAEKEKHPRFYTQNVNNFSSPEGRASHPENAFRASWQRFDQFIDVFWDSDLKRFVVPFANLYRHISDWPYGWQTSLEVTNNSGEEVVLEISNHLWYGVHGHSSLSEKINENSIKGSFRVPAKSTRSIDPYRDVRQHEDVNRGHAFSLVQPDGVPWEHDSALSIKSCPGNQTCSEGFKPDLNLRARVFPNTDNAYLWVKPQNFVQLLFKRLVKREATEAEVNQWVAEMVDGRRTRAEVALEFLESAPLDGAYLETTPRPLSQDETSSRSERDSFLNRACLGLLGQMPDGRRLAKWRTALSSGTPKTVIIEEILNTPEFRRRFGEK